MINLEEELEFRDTGQAHPNLCTYLPPLNYSTLVQQTESTYIR